jgi:hypothetical protein
MPNIIESLMSAFRGSPTERTKRMLVSGASASGLLKNRDAYNQYVEDLAMRGETPLPYPEWVRTLGQ